MVSDNNVTKAIFLDMDGVVWGYSHEVILKSGRYPHSKECIENLNYLLEKTHADIVWSSSWRVDETLASSQEIMNILGIKGRIVGTTPVMNRMISMPFVQNFRPYIPRRFEIEYYLQTSDIERFVILDDDPDAELNPPKEEGLFVFTDDNHGLTRQQADEAINFLNK